MDKRGFDNEKYLEMQSSHIAKRIAQFGNKLYMEFGGKLFDDFHASRVLPGFEPDGAQNSHVGTAEGSGRNCDCHFCQ